MGWWITLGILALLAVLPLGVSVRYDSDGAVVRVIAGPLKITLFPRPKKEKKPQKEKKPKPQKEASKPQEPPKLEQSTAESQTEVSPAQPPKQPEPVKTTTPAEKPAEPKPAEPEKAPEKKADRPKKKGGGSVTDFLPLVKIALDFLGDFRRKLRVNVLELKIILAADDPCDLAVNYGRAWAAVGNLLPRLERVLVIRKRDINVECDFTASDTTILARLDLTITLGRILAAVFVFAFRAIVEFLKIMKKRKGGAVNEPKSS